MLGVTVKIIRLFETDPDPIFLWSLNPDSHFLIHNIGLIAIPEVTVKIIRLFETDPDPISLEVESGFTFF